MRGGSASPGPTSFWRSDEAARPVSAGVQTAHHCLRARAVAGVAGYGSQASLVGRSESRSREHDRTGGRTAMIGHHDRIGRRDDAPSRAWIASDGSRACGQQAPPLGTGGAGLLDCFAVDRAGAKDVVRDATIHGTSDCLVFKVMRPCFAGFCRRGAWR